jgi:hypothetical protein
MSTDVDETLTERLITLSDENRDSLLENARIEKLRRQVEANNILEHLKMLSPQLAQHFEPKTIAIDKLILRMLMMPEPGPLRVSSVTSYVIVSYCWHYSEQWTLAPVAQAHLLKPGWEISQKMANAVIDELKHSHEGIWIDKLCIDQSDQSNNGEKATAIGAMDLVYHSARRVIILLEDIQLEAEEGDTMLLYQAFYEDMGKKIFKERIQGAALDDMIFNHSYLDGRESHIDKNLVQKHWANGEQVLKKMLAARWFSRAWCAHESRVSKHPFTRNNPIFLCFGADGEILKFEIRFLQYYIQYCIFRRPTFTSNLHARPNPSSLPQLLIKLNNLRPQENRREDSFLLKCFKGLTSTDCSKKEDMVSIALNVAGLPLVYRGSLRTKDDAVCVIALLTIATDNVLPLLMDGPKLRIASNDEIQVGTTLSWTQDFQTANHLNPVPLLDSSSITRVTKEYIELDILLFKNLPQKPSIASLASASKLLTEHHLDELAQSIAVSEPKYVRDVHDWLQQSPTMKSFTQTWLAIAIDCGFEWITTFSSTIIEKETNPWYWGQFAANTVLKDHRDQLHEAAVELLSLLGKTEENAQDFSSDYLDPTMQFFEYLLDARLKMLAEMPRMLNLQGNECAITPRIQNTTWVAVPVAVAHSAFWQQKAWIIEAFDPDGPPENPKDHWPDLSKWNTMPNATTEDVWPVLDSDYASNRAARNDHGTWKIRTKQPIFGYQSILPDGEFVVLLKKQRVYGAEEYDWATIGKAGDQPIL